MSSSKKGRKLQSITGKDIPIGSGKAAEDRFAEVIANALQRDFGETHAAIKIVAGLADANERALKIGSWRKMVRAGSI